ncbi:MAG: GntR family transcriptional regulator [Oscillospiraceae bacterium]|nr:GntR family transcriptional regulator [Oscillospiraceae bacterium]
MANMRESVPIYVQIAESIKDHILEGTLRENEQITSTTVISKDYDLSIPTVNKGISLLVNEGLVYKKRGIGMFVAEGAVEKLIGQRRETFRENYVKALLKEAKRLRIPVEELQSIVSDTFRELNEE